MSPKQTILQQVAEAIPDSIGIIDVVFSNGIEDTGSERGAITRKLTGEHTIHIRWSDDNGREEEKIQSP